MNRNYDEKKVDEAAVDVADSEKDLAAAKIKEAEAAKNQAENTKKDIKEDM